MDIGSILVVCHIYHQMDIGKFIRASSRPGLMFVLTTPIRLQDISV
jgi:hypothetical protein